MYLLQLICLVRIRQNYQQQSYNMWVDYGENESAQNSNTSWFDVFDVVRTTQIGNWSVCAVSSKKEALPSIFKNKPFNNGIQNVLIATNLSCSNSCKIIGNMWSKCFCRRSDNVTLPADWNKKRQSTSNKDDEGWVLSFWLTFAVVPLVFAVYFVQMVLVLEFQTRSSLSLCKYVWICLDVFLCMCN